MLILYTIEVIKMNNKYCFVNIFESKLNSTRNEKVFTLRIPDFPNNT